jgi:hypothetical protein
METILNYGNTIVKINDSHIRISHENNGKAINVQYEIYSLLEKLSELLKLKENENENK